jgi:alpha-glucosidase
MLLLTLRGTPTIYYGDEIGMKSVILQPDEVRDPFEKNAPGLGLGRDGCRTPMQWDATMHAGFSVGKPWLPLPDSFGEVNVGNQRDDAASIYQLYRRLVRLRRQHPALSAGAYRPLTADGDVLLFICEIGGSQVLVALNFGGEPARASLPDGSAYGHGAVVIAS